MVRIHKCLSCSVSLLFWKIKAAETQEMYRLKFCKVKKCRLILLLPLLEFHTYFQSSVSGPESYKIIINSSASVASKFLFKHISFND